MNRPTTAVGPKRLPLLTGATLVLFAVLVQLSVGPVHLFERASIRKEMKQRLMVGLPSSELTIFRLTGTEFKDIDLEDDGREMEVDGLMYDIVRLQWEPDGIVVVEAVRDDAETQLMADLERLVQGQLVGDTRGQKQRVQLVSAWCTYHEAIGPNRFWLPSPKELGYAEVGMCTGRTIGAIDPGPPRRA